MIRIQLIFLMLGISSLMYSQNEFVRNGKFYPASKDVKIRGGGMGQRSVYIRFAKNSSKAFVIFSMHGSSFGVTSSDRVRGQTTFLLEDRSFIYLNDYSEYYTENKAVYTIYRLTESEVKRLLKSEVSKIIYHFPDGPFRKLTRFSASGPYSNYTYVSNRMFSDEPKKETFVQDLLITLFGEPENNANDDKLQNESITVSDKQYISLSREPSGVFSIPVIINDVLKINFILDSGGSTVVLTPDVLVTLLRTGTITESDFIGDSQYKLADGSIINSKNFVLKKLTIGEIDLENIRATVTTNIDGDLLIGQSALNKLGAYLIDFDNNQLIIDK